MALYKVTAKKTVTWGKVRFEKGMSVEIVIQGTISSTENKKKLKDAWKNKYGIDLQHYGGNAYFDYEKLN